jgi:hypothetical protein
MVMPGISQGGVGQALDAVQHALQAMAGRGLGVQKFLMGFGGLVLKGLHRFQAFPHDLEGLRGKTAAAVVGMSVHGTIVFKVRG